MHEQLRAVKVIVQSAGMYGDILTLNCTPEEPEPEAPPELAAPAELEATTAPTLATRRACRRANQGEPG